MAGLRGSYQLGDSLPVEIDLDTAIAMDTLDEAILTTGSPSPLAIDSFAKPAIATTAVPAVKALPPSVSGGGESAGNGPSSPKLSSAAAAHTLPALAGPVVAAHNLDYFIAAPTARCCRKGAGPTRGKQILYDISTTFGRPGEGSMTAIMGQSGAGKTTLLNIFAMRSSGEHTGTLAFNNHPLEESIIRQFAGYVKQEDVHFADLSAREILLFVCQLKHPDLSKEEVADIVDVNLDKMGLLHVADTMVGEASATVGGPGRGLSGGERKRLSIAVALVSNPSLLFLDEYTSGLDSETALSVTHALQRLARTERRTIIATVHQPSADIFESFDELALLAQGRIVYHSAISHLDAYLASLGPDFVLPTHYSLAEWLMKKVFVHSRSDTQQTTGLQKRFLDSPYGQAHLQAVKEATAMVDHDAGGLGPARRSSRVAALMSSESSIPAPVSLQLRLLFHRAWTLNIRSKFLIKIKTFITIATALIFGFMFWDIGLGQRGVQDRVMILLFSTVVIGVRSVMESANFFSHEKVQVLRENHNGVYGIGSYVITKVAVDLPFQVIYPLIFAVIMSPMTNLKTDASSLFTFWIVLTLLAINSQTLGIYLACAIQNSRALAVITPVTILPLLLLGGLSVIDMPGFLRWVARLVYLIHGSSALMQNEFGGRTFACDNAKAIEGCNATTTCALNTGEDVLELYRMDDDVSIGMNCLILSCYAIVVIFGAYLTLNSVAKKKSD
jgi:ABC-type multidrug transport system ATPase subunit